MRTARRGVSLTAQQPDKQTNLRARRFSRWRADSRRTQSLHTKLGRDPRRIRFLPKVLSQSDARLGARSMIPGAERIACRMWRSASARSRTHVRVSLTDAPGGRTRSADPEVLDRGGHGASPSETAFIQRRSSRCFCRVPSALSRRRRVQRRGVTPLYHAEPEAPLDRFRRPFNRDRSGVADLARCRVSGVLAPHAGSRANAERGWKAEPRAWAAT
jgi:hypothetical protein